MKYREQEGSNRQPQPGPQITCKNGETTSW